MQKKVLMQQINDKESHEALKARLRDRIRHIRRAQQERREILLQAKQLPDKPTR